MLKINQYVKAKSLEEAYILNQKKSNVILGGMHMLKLANKTVGTAIDLSDLGLEKIIETETTFEIGAYAALRDIENHIILNKYSNNAVKEAVKNIVGVQFRNTATVGGSIFGRYGFSDILTVFLSMDTYVELYKGGIIPLEEFSKMPRDNDILVKIIVNKKPVKISYIAQRHQQTDFPTLTCAVSCLDGKWRAVIGARPLKAEVIYDEKNMLSDLNNAAEFGKYAAEKVVFGSDLRGSADYRKQIASVLIKRAVLSAGKED